MRTIFRLLLLHTTMVLYSPILHPIHRPVLMIGRTMFSNAEIKTSRVDSKIPLLATLRQTCLLDGQEILLQGPLLTSGHMGKSQVPPALPMKHLSPMPWRLISQAHMEVT